MENYEFFCYSTFYVKIKKAGHFGSFIRGLILMYSNQIAQNHQSQILDLLKFSNEQILRAHKYAKIDF